MVAGDEYPLECTAAADAVGGAVDVVVDLGVVDFKDFGEIDLGSIDEHQVARTTNGEAVGNGLVGTYLAGVGFALDTEAAHGPVKMLGSLGQGLDADVDAVGAEVLLDSLCGVEEGVVKKVPDGACALALTLYEGQNIKVEGFDGELAALLGKEGSPADFGHHVATSVYGLLVLMDGAVARDVFTPETFVAGQFVNLILAE